jgi:hypothetical protein
MMTVSELIDELQKIDKKDRTVMLSMDPEGNKYSPLDDAWLTGAYSPNRGEVGLECLTGKDRENGYTEEDVINDGLLVLIFYPKG